MVVVAQLVRALVCGTRSRRFKSGLPPKNKKARPLDGLFLLLVCQKNVIYCNESTNQRINESNETNKERTEKEQVYSLSVAVECSF